MSPATRNQLAFARPVPKDQRVLIVRFAPDGNVTAVERRGLEQVADISPTDKTPTLGRETGLIEDLFGNIGQVGSVPGGGGPRSRTKAAAVEENCAAIFRRSADSPKARTAGRWPQRPANPSDESGFAGFFLFFAALQRTRGLCLRPRSKLRESAIATKRKERARHSHAVGHAKRAGVNPALFRLPAEPSRESEDLDCCAILATAALRLTAPPMPPATATPRYS
jgi:hypothetical protein